MAESSLSAEEVEAARRSLFSRLYSMGSWQEQYVPMTARERMRMKRYAKSALEEGERERAEANDGQVGRDGR